MRKTAIAMSMLLMGATCGVRHDTSAHSSVEAGDETVIFSGFGKTATDGLIHVRASEGASPTGEISVRMPKLKCDRESCASVDLVRQDGTLVPLGGIPKGKTSLSFPISKVTGDPDSIKKVHAGPYRVLIEAYFEDDGEEWKFLGSGVIYLTILEPGYVPLGCDGADVAWSLGIGKNCEAQYTTKFRTALCGGGCD